VIDEFEVSDNLFAVGWESVDGFAIGVLVVDLEEE